MFDKLRIHCHFQLASNVIINFIMIHILNITAVIEHVRDGCTVRLFLLPSFQYVTVMFTGIKVGFYFDFTFKALVEV